MDGRKTADVIKLLIECRQGDPEDRRTWDAAKQSVHRWLNGWSMSIQNLEEARCLAVKLGREPDYLIIAGDPQPIGVVRDLRRLELRIAQLEARLEDALNDRAERKRR